MRNKPKNSDKHSIFTELRTANKFAYHSSPVIYVLLIFLTLFNCISIYVSLSFTEYIVNAAYNLINGDVLIREVVQKVIIYTCAIVFFQAVAILITFLQNKLRLNMNLAFEELSYRKLSGISWEYYESHESTKNIYEMRQHSFNAYWEMTMSALFYISLVPTIIIYFYYLIQIHVVVIPVYILLIVIFNLQIAGKMFAQLGNYWREVQPYKQKKDYFFGMIGNHSSHQEFRFLRLLDFTFNHWNEEFDKEFSIRLKIFKKHEVTLQTARLIFNIPYILMMVFIAILIFRGRLEIGFLVMANSLLNNIIDTCIGVQRQITQDHINQEFVQVYETVMKYDEPKDAACSNQFDSVELRHISYKYPQSDRNALSDFNFTFRRGEKIAVVGVNGSGKTTFTNLICKLTYNFEGQIRILKDETVNDTDNSDETIYPEVSCVFQDFAQYQMSIYENIVCGDVTHTFSEEEVWNILDQVGLKETVQALPSGIHTSLGQLDKGIELSKGQWQRIAIARLLAKKEATIWILDEPTAYLDPISEIEIYNLINELSGNRTVLFISHRLGFARKADRIVVFEGGKIIEDGEHSSLMQQGGRYAEMYNTQKSWYTD